MGSGPGGALDFRWGEAAERQVPGGEQLHCASLFVYSFISTVVVVVISLCCPSKLPLSQPSRFQGFFLFSPPSPPYPTGGGREE